MIYLVLNINNISEVSLVTSDQLLGHLWLGFGNWDMQPHFTSINIYCFQIFVQSTYKIFSPTMFACKLVQFLGVVDFLVKGTSTLWVPLLIYLTTYDVRFVSITYILTFPTWPWFSVHNLQPLLTYFLKQKSVFKNILSWFIEL